LQCHVLFPLLLCWLRGRELNPRSKRANEARNP